MPVLDELCENCDRPATHLEGGVPLCDSANCNSTKQSRFEEKKLSFEDFEPAVEQAIIAPVRQIPVTDSVALSIHVPGRKQEAIVGKTFARCVKCGDRFEVRGGAGGKYCSRECYEGKKPMAESAPPEAQKGFHVFTPPPCGCGRPATHRGRCSARRTQSLESGASSAIVPAQTLCACGKPAGHRGRCPGSRNAAPKEEIVLRKGKEVHVQRSVEHSVTQTRKETVTVSEHAHEISRKVSIIVPKAQPVTQVELTPQIAQLIWKSLTVQQKYDLMDCEGMWNDLDDEFRMSVINKTLLVYGANTKPISTV